MVVENVHFLIYNKNMKKYIIIGEEKGISKVAFTTRKISKALEIVDKLRKMGYDVKVNNGIRTSN